MRRALALGGAVLMAASVLVASPAWASPTAPPTVGECTNDPTADTMVLNGSVVDCAQAHTGVTIYIGTWTSDISPATADTYGQDSPELQKVFDDLGPQYDACLQAFIDLVQDDRRTYYIPSVLNRSASGPNADQWAAGERWLRCDLVASSAPRHGADSQLMPLPAPEQLVGAMRKPLKSNPWAKCAWANPTSWASVDCASSDASFTLAAAFSGSAIGKWPGSVAKVWDRATAVCRANTTVRSLKPDLLDVEAWRVDTSKMTKANYKQAQFRCAVPRKRSITLVARSH